ncbi:MAG: ATP-binding protein [Bacteroidota bacterium]
MNTETKQQIIKALEVYMELHKVSQSDVAKFADVNAGYLIEMRKGNTGQKVGVKYVEFKDTYYIRIANYIGFELNEREIETKTTTQLVEILTSLNDSKEHCEPVWIIGETGAGKTYVSQLFEKKFPSEVFSIKIGSSDNLADILTKIAEALRMDYFKGTKSNKIGLIVRRLKKIKDSGLNPQLNFDESEYMKVFTLCAYKELFDALKDICPVNLIGTPELLQNVDRAIKLNRPGIAQLFRRVKFKIKHLSGIDTKFDQFLEGIDVELKKWLQQNCNNYGELTDVLTPCLREAKRTGNELTLPFVKMVLGL